MGFMEWIFMEFDGILGLLYIPNIALLTSVPVKTFFSFKSLIKHLKNWKGFLFIFYWGDFSDDFCSLLCE